MKSLNGHTVSDLEQSPTVETYWVVDVFGQNDKIKRKSRRPPTYHAEEYSNFFRKLISSGSCSGPVARLYGHEEDGGTSGAKSRQSDAATSAKHPADVSDALRKLRQDLCSSFASFSKEFASDTCDGVSLLMDLLRAIQMAQVELSDTSKQAASGRGNRRLQMRNANADELELLLCLHQLCLANGHVPGKDHGCSRLLAHSAGFYGLALSSVSNLTKTRSIALQLMTALCKMAKGHSRVSEALTTLRLNMGEPVRMKLLTGIINSAASRVESLTESNKSNGSESTESSLRFLVEAMAFLNAFVHSAPDLRHKVVIQWEVEEAALDIHALSKVAETTRSPLALQLKQQLTLWADSQMDISLLLDRLTNVTSTNEALRKDLQNLRSRLLDLEIEKRRFAEFENDMKQRCKELETELATLRSSTATNSPSSSSMSVETRPSDAEESLILVKDSKTATLKRSAGLCNDEEDYTIDDVIEELNNIVNSAESDMNTESSSNNDSASLAEQPVRCNRLASHRHDTLPPNPTVHLEGDLIGETSDFTAGQVPAPNADDAAHPPPNRNKLSRTYFGQSGHDDDTFSQRDANHVRDEDSHNQNESLDSDAAPEIHAVLSDETDHSSEVVEEKIQPDILRTIPSRLFQKAWNVVEARSPLYMPEANVNERQVRPLPRSRPISMDDLVGLSNENRLFDENLMGLQGPIRSTYQMSFDGDHEANDEQRSFREADEMSQCLSESPIDRAASLGDLQVGDVFSFQFPHPGSEIGRGTKKTKRNGSEKSRHPFHLSNFLPAFLKANAKPNRRDWEAYQTERALMKDYRQNFRRSPNGVPAHRLPPVGHYNDLQFWPATFQALPYRNIPSHPVNAMATIRSERNRSAALPSPTQLARGRNVTRATKLMDHPSGLY